MKQKAIAILFATIVLTGCSGSFSSNSNSNSSVISTSETSSSTSSGSTSDMTSSSTSQTTSSSTTSSQDNIFLENPAKGRTFQDQTKRSGMEYFPTVGTKNMLVIPVNFTDKTCSSTSLGCAKIKSDLEAVFFGKSEDTGWESVASFYEKSSYGNLKLQGKVTDYFTFPKTAAQTNLLKSETQSSYYDPTYTVLEQAIDWYKKSNNDISLYDNDKNGTIDGVWLVYMQNYYTGSADSIYWAYTYWYYDTDINATSANPSPFTYAWASYNFMYEGGYAKPDGHTFIHETGHMLGLDDYYNYDTSATDSTSPAGSLDMMDNNILDHNAFSKYQMDWINPKVVNGSGTVQLSSFQKNGDAIIVPSTTWNGSVLDEYLIIEYYTPTGLNELDARNRYCGNYPLGFTINGFKIYHVDARLAVISGTRATYATSANVAKDNAEIVASNSTKSGYRNYRLLTLLSAANNHDDYYSKTYAKNIDLFTETAQLQSYTFHSGKTSGYLIQFGACNANEGTITFTKL